MINLLYFSPDVLAYIFNYTSSSSKLNLRTVHKVIKGITDNKVNKVSRKPLITPIELTKLENSGVVVYLV